MGIEWNADQIATLRREWSSTATTTQIGDKIGCGKSAVIGKARRLQLGPKGSPEAAAAGEARHSSTIPMTRPPATRMPRIDRPAASRTLRPNAPREDQISSPPAPLHVVAAPPRPAATNDVSVGGRAGASIDIIQRAPIGECCWPIGEPRTPGFRYCNEAVYERRSPYCSEHKAVAVLPRSERSERPEPAEAGSRMRRLQSSNSDDTARPVDEIFFL